MPNAVYNRDFQPELFLQEKDEKYFLESDEGRELYENVEKYISKLFSTEQQPTASEILSGIENEIGWQARWVFWSVVKKMRHNKAYESYSRNYLETTLNDHEIRKALAGDRKMSRIHRSAIDDLLRRSASYRNSEAFWEMISFTARFRSYSPYNNMLVKIQNPSCSYFATAKHWWLEFRREVKEDARPLLILAPMHPLMPVFDLDQTEGPPLPRELRGFASTTGEFNSKWKENLLANAKRDRILVKPIELSSTTAGFAIKRLQNDSYKMRIAYHKKLDAPSAFGVLCHELAHVYLGHLGSDKDGWWPCRINLSHPTVEIEAEATAYIVTTQLGLKATSEVYLSSFIKQNQVPPSVSVELITKTAGKIMDMVVKKLPPRKKPRSEKGRQSNQSQLL
jgi:hypothetical protein